MRYILVCGGVISGIGKGVISSSLGTLLKGCGLTVTSIKIDPYLNIGASKHSGVTNHPGDRDPCASCVASLRGSCQLSRPLLSVF